MVKTAGSGQPATTRKVQTSSTLPEVRASAALLLGRTCWRVSREASPVHAAGRREVEITHCLASARAWIEGSGAGTSLRPQP